jgi:uncharacterized membrane protein YraQ (UPF0718 family)
MLYLYIFCAIAIIASLIADISKTKQALKTGAKLFFNTLPTFLIVILIVSILIYIITPDRIANLLSYADNISGVILASIIGSIVVLPGFVAYPIAGVLKDLGVSYSILASFTLTLMLVGVLTFPLEKKYFGVRFAVIRNIAGYIIALITVVIIAFILEGGIA